MARISGIDLPREKRIEIGLTYIFGIGLPTAQKLLARTGVDPNTRVKNLTEDDEKKLREAIDGQIKVEGDLRREVAGHIKRLTDIGFYRGLRHRRRPPVRCQRTNDDARTTTRLTDIRPYRALRPRRGLPVRGQRTKTNARTRKGPKKTVGAKKK